MAPSERGAWLRSDRFFARSVARPEPDGDTEDGGCVRDRLHRFDLVADLAFTDPVPSDQATIGVLAASILAAACGTATLLRVPGPLPPTTSTMSASSCSSRRPATRGVRPRRLNLSTWSTWWRRSTPACSSRS